MKMAVLQGFLIGEKGSTWLSEAVFLPFAVFLRSQFRAYAIEYGCMPCRGCRVSNLFDTALAKGETTQERQGSRSIKGPLGSACQSASLPVIPSQLAFATGHRARRRTVHKLRSFLP